MTRTAELENQFMGIDIGKDSLHVAFSPQGRAVEIANTPERWERFLAADDGAAELLEGLLRAAEDADVPEDYREPDHKWHDHGEVCDELGQHEFGSVFLDGGEREATRRMTWTLMNDPGARALLSGLTRRRDAFVADEAGP